ncbi:hypothetical protein BS50DRAFT_580443 [Corynespora cassiicola Philippines]|uniref:Uncharacterized protein n=1 Tax=Corynespora cassiicola Philippines TaxID=1448308 RepID=A0A2T2N015_CORCC|nr:hypothetical protein BS50DRAFT_580466 [Corynespora cassiicola Philippines]PSN58821.1 hypothetical protein BS50DRAFT_580443 [Corynespora cassiicola Philippines]
MRPVGHDLPIEADIQNGLPGKYVISEMDRQANSRGTFQVASKQGVLLTSGLASSTRPWTARPML